MQIATGTVPLQGSRIFDRANLRSAALLVASAIVMIGIACHAGAPVYDSALFAEVGRSIAGGATLYRDVWDNKLPSIFYVNALWNVLFGDHLLAQAIAEAAIDGLSVLLFARLMQIERIKAWATPAALLGVFLAMFGYANDTEHYAIPLIIFAVLSLRSRHGLLAGISVAAAATFWIPAFLMLAVAGFAEPRRRTATWIAAASFALAGIVACIAVFGLPLCAELVRSWTAYVGGESLLSRFSDARSVAVPLSLICAGGLTGFVTAWHVRATQRGSVALTWIVVALAGALVPMHPFVHYFLPLVPAAIYAIVVSGRSVPGRAGVVAGACGLVLISAYVLHGLRAGSGSEAERVSRVAAILRAQLPSRAHIVLDGYEPGMYLATAAVLQDRFALAYFANPGFVAATKGLTVENMLESYQNRADAFVAMSGARPKVGGFEEVCSVSAAPWHLYVRPLLAGRFSHCR